MSTVDRFLYGFLTIATGIAIIFILMAVIPSNAKHLQNERWYQERWCEANHGVCEYRLPDGTRVDCVTDSHAIEFDFAAKWAEAIGQALYYSAQTGLQPGIVVIIETADDHRYIERLEYAIASHNLNIDVWVIQ